MQPAKPSLADSSLFNRAMKRFDEEHAQDPTRINIQGHEEPRELIYARWLGSWIEKLWPDAPEPLRLAGGCQHICRWKIPRENYPATRVGYLKWREDLKKMHAEIAAKILADVGYPAEVVEAVKRLNLKADFPKTRESRVLEDALCLVFVEHQMTDLAAKTDEPTILQAIRKSWKKMSAEGQTAALKLELPSAEKSLIAKALAPTAPVG
jgi:hypothetical protein